MRLVPLLLVAGCGFSVPQGAPGDARPDGGGTPDTPDAPPDMTLPDTWSVDGTSGKAVPATPAEWQVLINKKSLTIAPPDSIWTFQESTGTVTDVAGSVDLSVIGPALYQQGVPDWTRRAVGAGDGDGVRLSNISAPELPNLRTTSMTVLLYSATLTAPTLQRSVLFAGAGVPATLGQIDIDPAGHLIVTVGGSSATSAVAYGPDVMPMLFVIDHTNARHRVLTNREVIAPTFAPIGNSHGIFLGAADHAAPDARWVYMAAWYGGNAEMNDTTMQDLLTALGW